MAHIDVVNAIAGHGVCCGVCSAFGSTITAIADADGALAELYKTHYSSLVGLARVLVGDHSAAEEVVQEAFIRVRASWRGIRDPDRAAAYVRSAVLNQARSRLRRARVAAGHAGDEGGAAAASARSSDPAERAVAAAEREVLLARIRALPPRQRDCILLRYYLDLSEAEMARTLAISTGSVKTHLSRGLAALAVRLEDAR